MANKETKKQVVEEQEVTEALTTAGQWIIDNQNVLSWTVLGIVAVVFGCISINQYVLQPKHVEAANEVAKAVVYFQEGNLEAALNGDDADCLGFEEIAGKYSNQEGELAALYAGICYYEKGEYDEAAKYLKKFSADDVNIDPAAKLLLGNAYVEVDELAKAANVFESAAKSNNEILAPIALKKAGLVYLEMGKNSAAKAAFEAIKANYPASAEAQDIEKYIAIAE